MAIQPQFHHIKGFDETLKLAAGTLIVSTTTSIHHSDVSTAKVDCLSAVYAHLGHLSVALSASDAEALRTKLVRAAEFYRAQCAELAAQQAAA